jgi:hypothetical protein
VFVPNGQTDATYWIQGVEGATGSITLTASAPGFIDDTATVDVVQPALRIESLDTTTTNLSANDEFFARIGIPLAGNSNLSAIQSVRPGGSVTVTFTNTHAAVARLTTEASSQQTQTLTIGAGQSLTPTTVAAGGVAFDPVGNGMTTVTATAPAFITTTAGTVEVTVATPTISLLSPTATVGAGLQDGQYTARLGATNHGGVAVTITSGTPSTVLLASNSTSVGMTSITINVPNGQTDATYWIQGVDGANGSATITATATGFTGDTATVEVVQPALQIESLPTSISATGVNNDFFVRVGIPSADNTTLIAFQGVRFGGSLNATVTNSNGAAAQLVTLAGGAQSRTVVIPATQSISPTSVAAGGVAFDPLAAGETVVSATIPGYIATSRATVTVTVQ